MWVDALLDTCNPKTLLMDKHKRDWTPLLRGGVMFDASVPRAQVAIHASLRYRT